ncbi:hypothetical protein ABT56_11030 [Photobacterium aquae]|uniref:DUF7668 domain-containing protein n=1 Tax=Photobacterium aquae TaxID=1195763 RepID=A0A0J1H105_9GAMM|nr:hypothetical protein [Photobacterium aquae]KLV05501.1 hypothetical protein ABT56_11030 [Photobacterium aquae]
MTNVPIIKDDENQHPIPSAWRPIFSKVINSFVNGTYMPSLGFENVKPITKETAEYIKENIDAYGETLIPLPDEAWESSVCMWMGNHWDVLIDLWTADAGASDLVLGAKVLETDGGHIIEIIMVYVP